MLNWLRRSVSDSYGIRLDNDKSSTLRSRIMPTPLPSQLRISLRQADGSFATPLVTRGDRVLRYQCLAVADTEFSAPVYSAASGTVLAVDEQNSVFADSSEDLCITLAVDEQQQSLSLQPSSDFLSEPPRTIRRRIADAGVRGGGGVGFPVAHKLQLGMQHGTRLLIINAVECEPYVSADEALIREYADEVITGAEILQHASGAERCVIAFQKGKPEALKVLAGALGDRAIEIHLAPEIYPAGNEQQLINSISGEEVPAGHYPAECGILVFNAGTARNVFLAVAHGIPCVSRIITLAGQALLTPKNFDAPLGTPVRHLLTLCGAGQEKSFNTLIGDPLRGHFLFDDESGVDITSRCIIAAGEDEFRPRAPASPCTHCGDCLSACAVGLRPYQLHRLVQANDSAGLQAAGLSACIDCGACTYSCPSAIDLAESLQVGKKLLSEDNEKAALSAKWRRRYEFLQYRRKRDKNEISESKSRVEQRPSAADFSRDQARLDIAAAVARVQAKRQKPSNKDGEQ